MIDKYPTKIIIFEPISFKLIDKNSNYYTIFVTEKIAEI